MRHFYKKARLAVIGGGSAGLRQAVLTMDRVNSIPVNP